MKKQKAKINKAKTKPIEEKDIPKIDPIKRIQKIFENNIFLHEVSIINP